MEQASIIVASASLLLLPGARASAPAHTSPAESGFARALLDAAASGERDPERLKNAALWESAFVNRSRWPSSPNASNTAASSASAMAGLPQVRDRN